MLSAGSLHSLILRNGFAVMTTKFVKQLTVILKIMILFSSFFYFILQAYVYTKAAKIVGIEINADFCSIQNKVIKKYNFQVCVSSNKHGSKLFSETLIHKERLQMYLDDIR
jgi:hypothetical protein